VGSAAIGCGFGGVGRFVVWRCRAGGRRWCGASGGSGVGCEADPYVALGPGVVEPVEGLEPDGTALGEAAGVLELGVPVGDHRGYVGRHLRRSPECEPLGDDGVDAVSCGRQAFHDFLNRQVNTSVVLHHCRMMSSPCSSEVSASFRARLRASSLLLRIRHLAYPRLCPLAALRVLVGSDGGQ